LEKNGAYSVRFPDLPGCVSCGYDVADAIIMAQDALCLWLYDMEQDKKVIPKPSDPKAIKKSNKEIASIVAIDTDEYHYFYTGTNDIIT